jgi:hypothetical protein
MAEQMGEYMEQEKDKKRQDAIGNSKHPRLLDLTYKASDFFLFCFRL